MRVPLDWLSELVDLDGICAEDIAEELTKAGLEVEDIVDGPNGAKILDVDVLPNMARCQAMVGVAREVAAVFRTSAHTDVLLADLPPMDPAFAPRIDAPAECKRFVAAVIEGVEVRDSPAWIQERLSASGVAVVNNLVDLGNYVMLELGQPVHLYDLAKLPGARLAVRLSRAGEALHLLSQPRDAGPSPLPPGIPVIVDEADRVLTVAGVIGGTESAVVSTRQVVLESACFDFLSIRRAQAALGMRTEASARFSRGVAPTLSLRGVRRFVALLDEVSPGASVRGVGEAGTAPIEPRTIRLSTAKVNDVVGAEYQRADVVDVLDRLGLSAAGDESGDDEIVVHVDDSRADLTGPHDLIEEVVRISGLDQIPATMPVDPVPMPQRDVLGDGEAAIRESLVNAGVNEVITYTLSSRAAHEAAGGAPGDPLVELLNPISPERSVVRRSLLPGLLESVAYNLTYRAGAYLFEQGVVAWPEEQGIDPELPGEREHVAFVMTGPAEPDALWSDPGRDIDFSDAADVVLGICHDLHIDDVRLTPEDSPGMAPGAAAAVLAGRMTLGRVGLVAHDVLRRFKIAQPTVVACELHADALVERWNRSFLVAEPSRFPQAKLDLSVDIGVDVPVGDVAAAADEVGPDVRAVWVFDVFTGGSLPPGRRALGLRLSIGSDDGTMTTAEAEAVRDRVLSVLAERFGAAQR